MHEAGRICGSARNKGDDKFLASFSSGAYLHVTADGGDGNDNITGSWGEENLKGGNGRDMLIGQANADTLDGGWGPDYLDGRDGNDTLICGDDYEANNAFGGAGRAMATTNSSAARALTACLSAVGAGRRPTCSRHKTVMGWEAWAC